MRSTEFVKITVVYGHIDENGLFVRKWPARKMAITDKSPGNASLSVKYVLLTDKSAEKGTLSVKFERNLGVPPRIIKNTRHDWREFSSLFSCVRGHDRSLSHLVLIGFRPATRLMISSCRVATALALIARAPPYLPPC